MQNDLENQTITTRTKGWSWMGFFFAYLYYAGYGKLKFAIILIVIFSIPSIGDFLAIFIAVYCGINAKKDLLVKQIPFNWDNVIIVIFAGLIFGICFRVWLPALGVRFY